MFLHVCTAVSCLSVPDPLSDTVSSVYLTPALSADLVHIDNVSCQYDTQGSILAEYSIFVSTDFHCALEAGWIMEWCLLMTDVN